MAQGTDRRGDDQLMPEPIEQKIRNLMKRPPPITREDCALQILAAIVSKAPPRDEAAAIKYSIMLADDLIDALKGTKP